MEKQTLQARRLSQRIPFLPKILDRFPVIQGKEKILGLFPLAKLGNKLATLLSERQLGGIFNYSCSN